MPNAHRKPGGRPRRKADPGGGAGGLGTWAAVDAALVRLAELRRQAEAIRRRAADAEAPLKAERAALLEGLRGFAEAHRADFDGRHVLRLAHGRVAWRPTARIAFHARPEQVVAHLEDRGLDVAVFTTKRASRAMLLTLPSAVLTAVGVERQTGQELTVELVGASGRPMGRPMRLASWPAEAP